MSQIVEQSMLYHKLNIFGITQVSVLVKPLPIKSKMNIVKVLVGSQMFLMTLNRLRILDN